MPDDMEASAAVAATVAPPIATGEIHQTRWDFLDIINRGAAAILQPDAGVCGGITEFRRIAALAAAHGITIAPHWLADLHVHLVASTPNATYVEFFTDTEVLNLMEIGAAAFHQGHYDLSKAALDRAIANIESVYADNEAAHRARSLWYEEGEKDFKGEPYERSMVFYYRGLLFLRDGDYGNARASSSPGTRAAMSCCAVPSPRTSHPASVSAGSQPAAGRKPSRT